MQYHGPAIICSVRQYGEHGAIVRAMTPDDGLVSGFVPGGRSTAMRPVLQPANLVMIDCRARTESQLASMRVELTHSRGPLFSEPLAATGLEWVTALTARGLPEQQPFPALASALDAVLNAIEAAPAARGWVASLVRYELLVLNELGFALDLSCCAVTGGVDDLAYVSPKTGRAVSALAGSEYRERLLPYPPFLRDGGLAQGWGELLDGMRLTGHFVARDVLHGSAAAILPARARLMDRLTRLLV